MKVELTEAFLKDLKAARDVDLQQRVKKMVQRVEQAADLAELAPVRALSGPPGYYRYRLGDYRAGFMLHDGAMVFLRCLHRKEIYRRFP